jgi:hypothetical protein
MTCIDASMLFAIGYVVMLTVAIHVLLVEVYDA